MPARETNGYRRYSETHLLQLKFVRHCRSLGMGLPDARDAYDPRSGQFVMPFPGQDQRLQC